jgi:plastocyanin
MQETLLCQLQTSHRDLLFVKVVAMKKQIACILLFALSISFAGSLILPGNAQMMGPETHTVTVGGDLPSRGGNGESMYMGYSPSVVVINAGDTIVWKALDGPHTVTSENLTSSGQAVFDSQPKVPFPLPAFLFGPGGFIAPEQTYVLDTSNIAPGTYGILCTLHQDAHMEATLTITSQTAPPGYEFPVVTGISSGNTEVESFNPENITVPQGTKVLFENLSNFEPHTVLSVATLANGTRVLGTVFDSSPMLFPPGMTWDQVPQANDAAVNQLGGALLPAPGMDTFSHTFTNPGTYVYYCKYHSLVENGNIVGMVGEVIVLPQSTTANPSPSNSQISSLSDQLNTAIALGAAGLILGVIAIAIGVWSARRSRKPA